MFDFLKKKPVVIYEFNAKGFPSPDLNWEKATHIYLLTPFNPRVIQRPPSLCPECQVKLLHQEWDYWKIENSGQWMVQTWTCPNGHGHYGEYA